MELLEALALPPEGWVCLVGGGGKSSLLLRLTAERAGRGLPALAATTTHIGVEQGGAHRLCRPAGAGDGKADRPAGGGAGPGPGPLRLRRGRGRRC